MIVFVSSVTAALRASVRPSTVTPVVTVIEARASTFPRSVEEVPSVAELPTCQKTLHDRAPLTRFTPLADAVMSVDAALKTNTAFGSPCPSRVTVPVIPNVPAAESYTPAVLVVPPSSTGTVAVVARPAASSYAVTRSLLACVATPSAMWTVPFTWPGGNPVTEVPGLSPRSPLTVVGPVFVTVEAARTA